MGPSGSGKTTLLDILSGRKTQGIIAGTILFGRSPPSRALLRRHCGYCEQQGTKGAGERLTVPAVLTDESEQISKVPVSIYLGREWASSVAPER